MSKYSHLMQQLETEQFAPDLAPIPVLPSPGADKNEHTQNRETEALRLVRQIFLRQTHLHENQRPPRAVVFAGINHGDGCSHVCSAVAKTLARNTLQSVCLVEANLRSPSLPGFLGTTNNYGLSDAILREGSVKSFAKQVFGNNMWLLSSGTPVEDARGLIASDQSRQRFAELREEFGFVLIDAPPLTRYTDALLLSPLSDGIVLILEGESSWRTGAEVVAHLRSIDVPILAAVLNKHSLPVPCRATKC